jgi:hypothetical protein
MGAQRACATSSTHTHTHTHITYVRTANQVVLGFRLLVRTRAGEAQAQLQVHAALLRRGGAPEGGATVEVWR